jgi:peptide-methionine (S)-S-oxide reductase
MIFNRKLPKAEGVPLHRYLKTPILPPYPEGLEEIVFAMGCFWGAEKLYYKLNAVYTTLVGYANGEGGEPTYEEVCRGDTGYAEVVKAVYDPSVVSLAELLKVFWENHDPTQGDRQGNDIGSQYRSGIYTGSDRDQEVALLSKGVYGPMLMEAGFGEITTEIEPLRSFYPAEEYHQQYLVRVPWGYCNHGPNGVECPVALLSSGTE